MEPRFLLQSVREYRKLFEGHQVSKKLWEDGDRCPENEEDVLAHAHAMLDRIEREAHEAFKLRSQPERYYSHMGDALYVLGMVQHALWIAGYRTMLQINADNRDQLVFEPVSLERQGGGQISIGGGDEEDDDG